MNATRIDILGLFPSFDSIGGVQASGRDAWEGIVDQFGASRTHLFAYSPASSKLKALLKVLRTCPPAAMILVWHLHLLRLVPFLHYGAARLVLFLHGIEAWKRHDSLTRFGLQKVDLFLSNSDHTWNRFITYNPEFKNAPHRTVHLGVSGSVSASTSVPSQPPIALMIARMLRSENYKGHREMIEAWPLVQKSFPEAELWIIGDGDLRRDLEGLARTHLTNGGIRFWGEIPDAEKEALLQQCRCLALPSSGEGFGLVYLEAMRAGRPCLVSTVDAGREVVNPPEAGVAANPENRSELAEAVLRLISSNGEWHAWSMRAQRRYETYFTASHFQKRLLAAIDLDTWSSA